MAITSTSIVNRALQLIGAERISSLSDTSKRAVAANEVYESLRDEVMESYPWNCCRKRAALSADVDTPEWGYDIQYALPADFLRMYKLEEPEVEYQIENGFILTDESAPLNILYIYKNEDEGTYTNLLASAISFRLAAELAYTIAQSNTLQQTMFQGYESVLSQARSNDAQQGTPDNPTSDTWLNARY